MSIFSRPFRSRDKPQNSYDSPSYSYFFGRSNSGKRVNDRTTMQHTVVYTCVRVLSEAIAQLPLHVYQYIEIRKERVPPLRAVPSASFYSTSPHLVVNVIKLRKSKAVTGSTKDLVSIL